MAFSTLDEDTQSKVRKKILNLSFNPTPVIDRQYFKSVYFREPGGVLLEIATDGPGFMIDEDKDELGSNLKLPPHYEPYRGKIEKLLVPVSFQVNKTDQ